MTANSIQNKTRVILDGKSYIVEIEDLNEVPLRVTVNGVRHEVELEQLQGTSPEKVSSEPVRHNKNTGQSGAAPLVGEVRSPMPGTILGIAVASGDRVSLGQTLCYLEAMKMKNAIRAPRDGVIAAVHVEESQTVAHGDVLLTFE